MKILVMTDLHSQRAILPRLELLLRSQKYDGVFMLGDLCNRNDQNTLQYASDFIGIVKNSKLPLFVVHGNQESDSVKLLYQQRRVSVHFNPRQLGDYTVVGVGYGDDFPTDPTFAADKILLTHEPPRAAALKQMEQKGDLANAPILHFCGHHHQLAKIRSIGKTTFVQVPSAMLGRAAELELPQKIVRFIHF